MKTGTLKNNKSTTDQEKRDAAVAEAMALLVQQGKFTPEQAGTEFAKYTNVADDPKSFT